MRVGICTQHGAVSEVPALFQRRLQPPYFLASTIATAPKITGALPYLSCGLQNPTRYVYSATAFQKTGVLHRWTTSRFPVCAGREGQPLDCCRLRFSDVRLILLPFYFGAALLIHGLKPDTSFPRVQGELQRAVHLTPFTAAPESCRPSCPNVLILTLSRLPIRRPLRSTRFINTDLRCTALGLRERF